MGPLRKIAAWGVHLFTASGAIASMLALVAIGDGRWRAALAWMVVAMAIDSFDGMLARAVRVREVLPRFDGGLLDNVVDYLGYVVVPAVFLVYSDLLPGGTGPFAASAMLLSSAYQFCQVDAKTDDRFFKGFPSFWNVAVFYLHFGGLPPVGNLAILVALTVGVFVPIKWAYPSRMQRFRGATLALTVLWGLSILAVLALDSEPGSGLVIVSLAYVPYYVAVSLWLSMLAPRRAAAAGRAGR